ncbi:MAG TPA: hypothetical protein VFH51_01590, partial [Myxococcota bacterium]|nr:hypothetical protein [Myxococcota bacterium]
MPSSRPPAPLGFSWSLALGLTLAAGIGQAAPAAAPAAKAVAPAPEPGPEPEPEPPLEPVEQTFGDMPPAALFGRDAMDFGASLYKALAKETGTVLFSPYQAQMALLLLASSADPNTRARQVTAVQPHQTEELLK